MLPCRRCFQHHGSDDCQDAGGSVFSLEMRTCCEVDGVPMTVSIIECEMMGGMFLADEDCDTDH